MLLILKYIYKAANQEWQYLLIFFKQPIRNAADIYIYL